MKINMKIKITTLLILLFSLVACVSTKPANTLNKAERRVITLNKGIQNQIDKYPSLIDKAYTYTFYDTLKIKGDTLILTKLYQDTTLLKRLKEKYNITSSEQKILIDSLLSLNYKYKPKDQDTVTFLEQRVNKARKEINRLSYEKDSIYNLYVLENNKRIDGTYEDSLFIVNYIFNKGLLNLEIKTKDKYKVVEKTTNQFTIKPKLHFWQDLKFYGLLIVLFNLIYFFGKELQLLLKRILKIIISFFRKLIFKI